MDEYQVKITRKAYANMEEIVDYIADELLAPEAARHTLSLLESAINGLSFMPTRNRVTEDEPWGSLGVRKMSVKNFLIYYWIDEEKKKVQVTAVLHGLQDQQRHLAKMDME